MMVRMIVITVTMLMMQPMVAMAVSLGRVDVASHLGEAFFAEIPLNMDKDESLSSIFVDLASPIEYRFLEVYRDQSITNLRTTIKQDARGLRVEIISSKALQSPYINLVLRVRHGRATHFKKFPIFLSLPTVATPKIEQGKPIASVTNTTPSPATEAVVPASQTTIVEKKVFIPFSGWARTNRYGPMVYGDTIFTVARRLRTDTRYSVRQVAIAIFNKNRKKFGKGNINLIKEGSYLDTPTANEVAALSRTEASAAMSKQIKAWKQLTQQPRFARVAEAQKNRYSKRVRVGTQGEGIRHASTPSVSPISESKAEPKVVPVHQPISTPAATSKAPPAPIEANQTSLSTEAQQRISQLKTDNDILQATITANNTRLAKLEEKLTASAAAGSNPKIKLLEARLTRIQRQLEQERSNNQGEMLLWLIYAAAGIIVLLIVVIGVLMRRQPSHPAQQQEAKTDPAPLLANIETKALEQEPPQEPPTTPSNPAVEEPVTEAPPAESTEKETEEEATSPDPDVDYLTEADVYLRYGMEDEAEAQVDLALQLRPNDPAVHAKLVEVRLARGNTTEADAAKAAAIALLTGGALATFEQLLAPSSEETTAEPENSEIAESPVAENASKPSEESKSDDDLLASISSPASDEDIDALLDINNDPPLYDDDDELQSLLSTVGADEGESEEDEDILDLSNDNNDDTDLESLISSLNISDEQETTVVNETPTPVSDQVAASTNLTEKAETTLNTDILDTIEQPETHDASEPQQEPTPPASDDLTSDNMDGDLAFDVSDLDLSKAKQEEPLVNTSAVESDSDLAFDASGLDLSDITLPGSSSTANKETTVASTAPASSASVTQLAEAPEPALSIEPTINMDLDLSSSVAASETTPPATEERAPPSNTPNETKESTTSEATPSGLDISLDMDDLDALLANDETSEPAASTAQKTNPVSEEAPQNQSVDAELGALLDGLDDLDLNNSGK